MISLQLAPQLITLSKHNLSIQPGGTCEKIHRLGCMYVYAVYVRFSGVAELLCGTRKRGLGGCCSCRDAAADPMAR